MQITQFFFGRWESDFNVNGRDRRMLLKLKKKKQNRMHPIFFCNKRTEWLSQQTKLCSKLTIKPTEWKKNKVNW